MRCWERDTKRRAQQQQQQQQKQEEEEEQQQKQKLWRRWEWRRLHLGSSQSTRRKLGAESGVPSEQKGNERANERTNDGEAKVEGWNIDDGTCGVDAFVRGCVRAYTKEKDEKGSER